MAEPKHGNFEGWAVIELFGHQREIGFVTTEAYGTGVLFRVDVPPLAERQFTLRSPEYVDGHYAPAGAVVKREPSEGRSRLIGPSAVYALNPCTEEAALAAIERHSSRPLMLVSMPAGKAIAAPKEEEEEEESDSDLFEEPE